MDSHQLSFFLVLFCYLLPFHSLVEAKVRGFTIEIIHTNSPLSPFYNHSATIGDISRAEALHSIARANRFRRANSPTLDDQKNIQSSVVPAGGGYLMKLLIGKPPVDTLAIADTGSDLVWVQCQPCPPDQCYQQDQPLFDPTKSSTYTDLTCDSQSCQSLPKSSCNTQNQCQYSYSYGDNSFSNGVLATDTFTFDSTDGQPASFPNSVFGCGHNNKGTFSPQGSGLVGLGGGSLSLISQLGNQIEQKFAYCLVPRAANSPSKMKFGADAVLTGPGVVSTPISSDERGTFYYLTLEGISVGDKAVNSADSVNIIIDSGTTLTMLESSLYQNLESAVQQAVGLESVQDPQGRFQLCYDKSSFSSNSNSGAEIGMTFHFTGADVTLKPLNLFWELEDVTCLTILPSDGESIFGNWAQMNFQVEYDLGKKQVSFAPADCTKF